MRNLVIRIFMNAVALWVAAQVVGGITLSDAFWPVVLVAAVFGLVNGLIRPLVLLLSFPIVVLTLGLFTLVVNALMLLLTAALVDALTVEGFLAALLGSIVISVVSLLFSILFPSRDD
jgi:putative membrane protein